VSAAGIYWEDNELCYVMLGVGVGVCRVWVWRVGAGGAGDGDGVTVKRGGMYERIRKVKGHTFTEILVA